MVRAMLRPLAPAALSIVYYVLCTVYHWGREYINMYVSKLPLFSAPFFAEDIEGPKRVSLGREEGGGY
jgi:hypothetical protein